MSRSGFHEADDDGDFAVAVEQHAKNIRDALASEKGQQFLRGLVAALDALPVKELTSSALVSDSGCCAMGAYCKARGIDPMDMVILTVRQPDGSTRPATLREELSISDNDEYAVSEIQEEAVNALPDLIDAPELAVRETVWINDECAPSEPAARWKAVRKWAVARLAKEAPRG